MVKSGVYFFKNLGKLVAVIGGVFFLCMSFGWLVGAESGKGKTEYYLYEYEMAESQFVEQMQDTIY